MKTFLLIAFRNLFSSPIKVLIIGSVLSLSTFFAIITNTFVSDISNGMKNSLTNSLTGDLQIFSSTTTNSFSIFGDENGNVSDVAQVDNFKEVNDKLLDNIANIKTIVPMGTGFAMMNLGNILDIKLEELRFVINKSPIDFEKIKALVGHIQKIIFEVEIDYDKNASYISSGSPKERTEAKENLTTAKQKISHFLENTNILQQENDIEFFSNKIAPLIFDDNMIYMNYLGTIPSLYKNAFSQFEIVKGRNIPDGKRGIIFTDYYYENELKHRIARRFDSIKNDIEKNRQTILNSKILQDKIKSNISQVSEIYSQLSPQKTKDLIPKLQNILNVPTIESTSVKEVNASTNITNTSNTDNKIKPLLETFLNCNDQNFLARYNFFYKEIAPFIILYKVKIDDIFPITSYSKRGSSQSVNLKVYGTYRFISFENSPIANGFNIIDIMSFRDLYGYMSPEQEKENQELESEMAMTFDRSFTSNNIDKAAALLSTVSKNQKSKFMNDIFEKEYTLQEMMQGIFINAAIVLKNTSPQSLKETLKQIATINKNHNLKINVIDWKEASGAVGQIITSIVIILNFSIFIIFLISAFIIMNAMVMAILERNKEIGTMRAIGAQRSYVISLILFETIIQGIVFGTIGATFSILLISVLNLTGVKAWNDVATFFFSGDTLHLTINYYTIALTILITVIVSTLSALYPAYRASKVPPIVAMSNN